MTGGARASASPSAWGRNSGGADKRGESRGIAGLEFDCETRCGRAIDNRFCRNLGGACLAREVDDDPGLARRQQAEAKALHERGVATRADAADRRIELKIDLRQVDDNAIGRGQGEGAGVDRARKVEHQSGRARVLRDPNADGDGRSRIHREPTLQTAPPSSAKSGESREPSHSRHSASPRSRASSRYRAKLRHDAIGRRR